jgi:hypothetical protein
MKGFFDGPTIVFVILSVIFAIMFFPSVASVANTAANQMTSGLAASWFRIVTPFLYVMVIIALGTLLFRGNPA